VARLKATDARNLPKPVRVTLGMKDKVAKSPDKLLKWIKNLNPGLHTEHWRVLNSKPELTGNGLIFLIDRDCHKILKKTVHKIFLGLTQGSVKVLRDPEEGPKQEEGAARSPVSSGCLQGRRDC
jgi:hypothetical protein